MMTPWPEDFSTCTLDEIIKSQAENRAWNKELRLQSSALVKSRLAKVISLDEYATNRKRCQEDTAECNRRPGALFTELSMVYSCPGNPEALEILTLAP